MKTYELTVLWPEADEKEIKKAVEVLDSQVKKLGGEILKSEEWGVRDLAYEIKKNSRAYYWHVVVNITADKQRELDRMLRLDEKILRYLFVKIS